MQWNALLGEKCEKASYVFKKIIGQIGLRLSLPLSIQRISIDTSASCPSYSSIRLKQRAILHQRQESTTLLRRDDPGQNKEISCEPNLASGCWVVTCMGSGRGSFFCLRKYQSTYGKSVFHHGKSKFDFHSIFHIGLTPFFDPTFFPFLAFRFSPTAFQKNFPMTTANPF